MPMNEEQYNAVEALLEREGFVLHQSGDSFEIENWTTGGVNMILDVYGSTIEEFATVFDEQVRMFDVDEAIDLHRQGQDYAQAFSIRESLEDFEEYEELLHNVAKQLLRLAGDFDE